MSGFSYNGTMGNEFSTTENPWGIMNKAEYSIFVDIANILKISSASVSITGESLQKGLVQVNHKLQILKARKQNLSAMPYDLGRKIDIDNLSIQINSIEGQYMSTVRFLNYFFMRYEVDCRNKADFETRLGQKPKKHRLTYSKVVKAWVCQVCNANGFKPDKGAKQRAKDMYDSIVNNVGVGADAMRVYNKNL